MRWTALAAAVALLGSAAPATALVVVGGAWSVDGGGAVGPGDTLRPTQGLWVGNGAPGSLQVDGASLLQVASLVMGSGSNGSGVGLLSGAGSRLDLAGNGFDQGSLNRFEVGGWGTASFTVAAGALLDGRANSTACLGVNHYCNSFIGNAAGSTGTFTVTDAGSEARFLRGFVVGGVSVFHPPVDGFTFGTPGGVTRGTVNVLAGGSLVTDVVRLGVAPGGGSPTGTERSFADVTIDGAGSLWRVTGGTLEATQAANVQTASHRNAWATLSITGGGQMRLEGDGALYTVMSLTNGGGRTDALVSGAGSRLSFQGASGVLNVGASLGTASLEVRDGGQVDSMFYAAVGRNGSLGTLLVDGAGSVFRVDGTATAAANGVSALAFMDIGRAGGNGTVTVSNGGLLEVLSTTGATNGTGMNLGRDANASGTLNITSGGVVLLRATSSAPGTAAETDNPGLLVGRDGSGFLTISGGGQLVLDGGAVSTPTVRRNTVLYIGGSSDTAVGGKGIAAVSGVGSEIRVLGTDTFIGVGIGPQSSGQLSVSAGATVSGQGMNVGRSGGVGVLKVDAGHLVFSGQQTAGNQAGAFLGFGAAGGIGTGLITNGSTVTLTNAGSAGAGLSIGGSSAFPGGDGALTLAGGSAITVQAAPGLGYTQIGREGSGLLRVRGASSLHLGDGVLTLGRLAGGDGTVILSEGSTVTAGWVGVGRNRTATGNVDGGTGTLVLVNSTLTAQDIVIGTNGFVGGSGTITGNVVNHGIFSPGTPANQPKLQVAGLMPAVGADGLRIDGNFTSAAGSRLVLEVQGDGAGGFTVDQVVLGAGHVVDLSGLSVEFRFLGGTNPQAFLQSGQFDIDSFVKQAAADGSLSALPDAAFAGTQFSASATDYVIESFTYAAGSAASFSLQPVPEPGSWLMLLAGVSVLGLRGHRLAAAGRGTPRF